MMFSVIFDRIKQFSTKMTFFNYVLKNMNLLKNCNLIIAVTIPDLYSKCSFQ